jgi:PAS domain-containing protein
VERDETKREIIRRLLGEEEFRLAILNDMQANEDLAQLLNLVALRSVEIFGRAQPEESRADNESKFAAILEQLPFGIGLIDGAGQCIIANAAMRRFAPEQIPSLDLRHIWQWRAFDAEGRPLDRRRWPGARALRGDMVCPGIVCVYTPEEGQQVRVRVDAVPVRYGDGRIAGAVAAVHDMERLVSNEVRQHVDELLIGLGGKQKTLSDCPRGD